MMATEQKYFGTARIEKLKSTSKEQEESFKDWLG